MKTKRIGNGWLAMWFTLALLAGTDAQAQQRNALVVSFSNLSLSRDTARARTQASTVAVPNDTLRYVLTFTNTESRAIQNVVFNNPLPRGLTLLEGTVNTSMAAKVEYSIDGGVTYAERPMVTVEENGRRIQRPATPASYTHIRWTVTDAVAPNATVTARYDTRVVGR